MLRRNELIPTLLIFSGVAIISWLLFLPIIEAKASLTETSKTNFVSPSILSFSNSLSQNFNLPSLPFSSLLYVGKEVSDFYLTIDRIGIKKARIIANVDTGKANVYLTDLLAGIGHLQGSSFPGEGGNVFLFGHSSLPFLFSNSDYSTIFSNLNKMKTGDTILVEFAGRKYFYRVSEVKTVKADAKISEFVSSFEKLTILTCFPPGLLTERLVVMALPIL